VNTIGIIPYSLNKTIILIEKCTLQNVKNIDIQNIKFTIHPSTRPRSTPLREMEVGDMSYTQQDARRASERMRPRMTWFEAIRIFIIGHEERVYFSEVLKLFMKAGLITGMVVDDVADAIPFLDFVTIGDDFVLVGIGIFAFVRVNMIHYRGNHPQIPTRR
jgi:hypothetical protein